MTSKEKTIRIFEIILEELNGYSKSDAKKYAPENEGSKVWKMIMKMVEGKEKATSSKPMSAEITNEMREFAEEYACWILTAGQKYINALSPKFTTNSSMDIFVRDYYRKGWLDTLVITDKKAGTNKQ